MKKNMGGFDVIIRRAAGLVFCMAYLLNAATGTTGAVLFLTGGVLIYTSMEAFCPLYALLGINSLHRTVKNKVAPKREQIFYVSAIQMLYAHKKAK